MGLGVGSVCVYELKGILIQQNTNFMQHKLTVAEKVKKFSTFHRTRMFITVFTTARYWPLSSAR